MLPKRADSQGCHLPFPINRTQNNARAQSSCSLSPSSRKRKAQKTWTCWAPHGRKLWGAWKSTLLWFWFNPLPLRASLISEAAVLRCSHGYGVIRSPPQCHVKLGQARVWWLCVTGSVTPCPPRAATWESLVCQCPLCAQLRPGCLSTGEPSPEPLHFSSSQQQRDSWEHCVDTARC